tara:strand:+ start:4687 stop:5217 length:531 start_codon:yes stop_codon:yes gene_type:complete
MNKIDKSISFIPVNIALITISDTRSLIDDKSGDLLNERISKFGHKIIDRIIIKDEKNLIKKSIINFAKNKIIDVIITTGGTGLTGRDSTTEVVELISDKIILGFGELFRQISYNKIGTSTIQSRAIGAIIKGKYIFCLPGSTSACKDGWDEILKYQLDVRHKPCNFIEIMPRLNEK